MATTESSTPKMSGLSRKRKLGFAAIGLLLVLLLAFFWNLSFIRGMSNVGSAYGAHIACSCRYIEGRDMKSCEGDKEDGMEIVSFTDDPDKKRVTASVPFFAKEVAEYRGEFGCIILNEEELKAAD